MSDVTIVSDLFNGISKLLEHSINTNVSTIASAIAPLMGAAFGLYMVLLSFKMLYDPPNLPIMDIIKTLASYALVVTCAFSVPYYMEHIVPFVMYAGDDLSSAILGQPDNAASVIDMMINSIMSGVGDLIDAMEFSITGGGMAAFLAGCIYILFISVGSAVFIVISTIYLVAAKFMVGLLLSAGSIFICFAFFPSTRGNFQSWVGQCLNYIMLSVFYSIAFKVEIEFINTKLIPNGVLVADLSGSFQLLIVFLSLAFLTVQIPVMTSHLTGGVGINGLVSSISGVGSALSKMLKKGGGGGNGGGGSGGKPKTTKNGVEPG
jgi:type IV secretion system protein VirB6